jgi:hypothetical protein
MPHISTKDRAPALAAFLILLLAAVGLAACGGSSSTTNTTTTTNAAATGASTGGATTTPDTASNGTSSTGSSTGATGATPGQPNAGRYTAVRECLSKKGITLPHRTAGAAGPQGGGIKLPNGMTHAQLTEALKNCNVKYAGGHFGRLSHNVESSRFRHVLAGFAACLRQNGVNVGEPNTSGNGPVFNTKGINTGSPQFRAASVKCRHALFPAPPTAGRSFTRPGTTG